MSFVDLMASDRWSESDIVRRTEAIIHGQFSPESELILNRLATGAALGLYQLSAAEQAQLARYAAVAESAREEGERARADMALLEEVLAMEAAAQRLAQPAVEPETDDAGNVLNQDELDRDSDERAAAQAVLDDASSQAQALYELRNPAPEPEPEPEP